MTNDNAKILGGTVAEQGDWGWTVSLYRNDNRNFCGAILINSQYILTAAHCFDSWSSTLPSSGVQIHFGLHNRKSMESWVQTRKAAKLFCHEKWNGGTSVNDIALIALDEPVVFNYKVVPACIDETQKIDVSNKVAWVTSWGAKLLQGPPTSLKYQVSMNMFTDRFCRSKYGSRFNSLVMICGGESSANSGPCQGDSGGPLVYNNPNDGLWYVFGIVSWGIGCGQGAVYTRVSNYIDWINQKIDLN